MNNEVHYAYFLIEYILHYFVIYKYIIYYILFLNANYRVPKIKSKYTHMLNLKTMRGFKLSSLNLKMGGGGEELGNRSSVQ